MSLLLLALLAADPPSSAYVQIRNQGVLKGSARSINCSGSGVTCAVNTTTAEATLTVNIAVSDAGSGNNWDGGPAIPACAAGFVLDGDGGSLYCTNVIATATALAANPTDCSANNYATAIAASGNLTCAQVSYSQLSGTPLAGGSVPQVQFNADGGLAGMTSVTSDGTHEVMAVETSNPSAPSAGATNYDYAPVATGWPSAPFKIDAFMGLPMPVGFFRGGAIFVPNGTVANWQAECHLMETWSSGTINVQVGGTTGMTSTGSVGTNIWANTNFKTRQKTTSYTSGAANNSNGSVRYTNQVLWRGNAAGAGGFVFWTRVWIDSVLGAQRAFFGLANSTSDFSTTTEPSAVTDSIYVGCDNTDTTLHICSNDNSGSATCSDLGANFPCKSGAPNYDIWFSSAPNGSAINYDVERLDSAHSATGSLGSDLPRNAVQMTFHDFMNSGPDAGANSSKFDTAGWCAWSNF